MTPLYIRSNSLLNYGLWGKTPSVGLNKYINKLTLYIDFNVVHYLFTRFFLKRYIYLSFLRDIILTCKKTLDLAKTICNLLQPTLISALSSHKKFDHTERFVHRHRLLRCPLACWSICSTSLKCKTHHWNQPLTHTTHVPPLDKYVVIYMYINIVLIIP